VKKVIKGFGNMDIHASFFGAGIQSRAPLKEKNGFQLIFRGDKIWL
jgi:hypothetical protein